MLQAEWPTLERTIAVWSDPSGGKGRVVTMLLENVELPPSLRVRNWIDFRDTSKYEEGFTELVALLTDTPRKRGRGGFSPTIPPTNLGYSASPQVITSSSGADKVQELIVTNHRSTDQAIRSAPSNFRSIALRSEFPDSESRSLPVNSYATPQNESGVVDKLVPS